MALNEQANLSMGKITAMRVRATFRIFKAIAAEVAQVRAEAAHAFAGIMKHETLRAWFSSLSASVW